jgi:hypothetical protein
MPPNKHQSIDVPLTRTKIGQDLYRINLAIFSIV